MQRQHTIAVQMYVKKVIPACFLRKKFTGMTKNIALHAIQGAYRLI